MTYGEKTQRAMDALFATDKAMLTPSEVAPVLGCHPYAINVQALTDPARLGFPVTVIGRRVKIPRAAFLAWLEGKEAD